ncbi:hypothetical protein [Thalassotalea sp. PLHSN55]
MSDINALANNNSTAETVEFDYDNSDWPRDFDIRIEKAEQREVLESI